MELGVKGRVHTYASILLGLIRERVDWVSRDLRRRRIRRRLGDDPTRPIRSPSDAIKSAEALLDCASWRDANETLWSNVAVRPLAELLYAASKQRNECGIEWAWHALFNIDADEAVAGWSQAAKVWDQAGAPLPGQLLRVAGLPPRQRHSVILIMHAAIAPWLAAARRSAQQAMRSAQS